MWDPQCTYGREKVPGRCHTSLCLVINSGERSMRDVSEQWQMSAGSAEIFCVKICIKNAFKKSLNHYFLKLKWKKKTIVGKMLLLLIIYCVFDTLLCYLLNQRRSTLLQVCRMDPGRQQNTWKQAHRELRREIEKIQMKRSRSSSTEKKRVKESALKVAESDFLLYCGSSDQQQQTANRKPQTLTPVGECQSIGNEQLVSIKNCQRCVNVLKPSAFVFRLEFILNYLIDCWTVKALPLICSIIKHLKFAQTFTKITAQIHKIRRLTKKQSFLFNKRRD